MRINPYKMFVGSFIPNWILRSKILTPGDKLVYARLAQFAGKNGECYPKQETIAEECGMSERAVIRSIQALVEHKFIEVERRGQGKPNCYFFLENGLFSVAVLDVPKSQFKKSQNDSSVTDEIALLSTEENQLRESEKREEPSPRNIEYDKEVNKIIYEGEIKRIRRDWEIFTMSINLIDKSYPEDIAIQNCLADPLFDLDKIKANIANSKRLRGIGKGNSKQDTVSLKAVVENANFRQKIMDGDFADDKQSVPTTFEESFVYNSAVFMREMLKNKKFREKYLSADIMYYYEAVESWAKRNNRKSADWIEEAMNFMRLDKEKQQLKLVQATQFKIRDGYGD